MHVLAAELKQRELEQHLGNRAEVLWEQQINSHRGQWIGYTPHYHKITSMSLQIGASDISEVSIDSISGDGSMLVNETCPPQVMLEDIEQHDARI